MKSKDQMNPTLISQLEKLRITTSRDPHAAAATRAAFLTEARSAARNVPPRPFHRLNIWMAALTNILAAPKNLRGAPMLNTVLTLIVVLGLAFGGGTVAAQTSMPDEVLYPLKVWSEETRMSFSSDPETQFQLRLQFATRRIEEIQTMLQQGEQPSEAVMLRLQNQLEYAMNLAANMPDAQLQASLLQMQTRLQEQEQNMTQLQLDQSTDPALLQIQNQVRTMLQEHLRLCQSGLNDPETLREQLRLREQNRLQLQLHDGTQEQDGSLNQNQNQEQNQNQNQEQNQDDILNQDQNQNQNQQQNQNHNGNNGLSPSTDPVKPPQSGEGNGAGPGPGDGTCPNCPCDGCDGDGSGSGPVNDDTGSNCPSGDGDCDGAGNTDPGGKGGKP